MEAVMKSMTIHKIDDRVLELIKNLADEKGESINSAIKELLAKAVGVPGDGAADARESGYRRFLNRWTHEEAAAFEQSTADFAKIDESDWA
jgi:hypothetical protein